VGTLFREDELATRVFLLRHGESADPTVFHGAESDVELSPRGQRQAAAVAAVLASYDPDVVVSSAMRRAVQTATPIAIACGRVVHIEPQLHERKVGALCGTAFSTKDGVWPDTLQRWLQGDTGYAPEGAESFDAIRQRVLPVWQRLTRQHAGQTLVIVAHGVVCRVLLLSVLSGLTVAHWPRFGPMKNVGINELLAYAETWQAIRINHVPDSVQAV
jgi:2,3-bisphosphoglycerate-dependent phosphoglycerate mutase